MDIEHILLGAVAGVSSAFIGYFRHTPVPEFSGPKFLKTMIIGAIVGGAGLYVTPNITTQFLETMGYTALIDRMVDLAWARVKALYNTLKGQ